MAVVRAVVEAHDPSTLAAVVKADRTARQQSYPLVLAAAPGMEEQEAQLVVPRLVQEVRRLSALLNNYTDRSHLRMSLVQSVPVEAGDPSTVWSSVLPVVEEEVQREVLTIVAKAAVS